MENTVKFENEEWQFEAEVFEANVRAAAYRGSLIAAEQLAVAKEEPGTTPDYLLPTRIEILPTLLSVTRNAKLYRKVREVASDQDGGGERVVLEPVAWPITWTVFETLPERLANEWVQTAETVNPHLFMFSGAVADPKGRTTSTEK